MHPLGGMRWFVSLISDLGKVAPLIKVVIVRILRFFTTPKHLQNPH
jgi:hypothetical protein